MGNKSGSDGQIRKTTAEWAADTATNYPEGLRLMDTDTGTVRKSKGIGTTYAQAWQEVAGSYSPPIPQDDVSGLTTRFEALEDNATTLGTLITNEATDRANADAALQTAVNSKGKVFLARVDSGGSLDGTPLNQLGGTPVVGRPADGVFTVTITGAFTVDKTRALAVFIDHATAVRYNVVYTSVDVVTFTFNDLSIDVDPNLFQLEITVYP